MSNASAARPASRAARAMSWWFSLQDPAPCSTTRPPSGARVGQPEACTRGRRGDPISAGPAGVGRRFLDILGAAMMAVADPFSVPRALPRSTTAGCRSAAATRSSWRASSARPPTSSPRTTCAPARGSSRPRWPPLTTGAGEVVFASKALPVTAVLRIFAEEGLSVDVASGGELDLALNAGFEPAPHRPARQREVRGRAAGGRRRRRRHDRARRRGSRPPRADRARGPRASACWSASRRACGADTHEAILTGHAESKFGFAPATAGADRRTARGTHRHRGPAHAPRLAAVRHLAVPGGDLDARGSRRLRHATTSAAASASPYTRHDRPPSAAEWVDGRGRHRARDARRRPSPGDRARPRARGQRRGDALHRRGRQADRARASSWVRTWSPSTAA